MSEPGEDMSPHPDQDQATAARTEEPSATSRAPANAETAEPQDHPGRPDPSRPPETADDVHATVAVDAVDATDAAAAGAAAVAADADAEPDAAPGPSPLGVEPVATGNAGVDAALHRLSLADGLPTREHVDVYEDVHGALRDTLAALDSRPGPPAPPHPAASNRS